MSTIRDEIRAILREEIAALRAETSHARAPERVQMQSSTDLDRFARDLVTRTQNDPAFAAAVTSGAQRFEFLGAIPTPANASAPRIVTGPVNPTRAKATELSKKLVTERDIEELEQGARVLRVPTHCCLTPLANDEARRRGIRIERFAS